MGVMKRMHLVLLAAALLASGARAASNDLSLSGLVDTTGSTPNVDNARFRQLSRELGLVLTPTAMQPAETTGQSGFDFALDYGFHAVRTEQSYWQDTRESSTTPLLMTLGARARKGFPLPVPLTSEVELGANWIIDSQLVNLGGNVRVALNEGFRFIPDLAVSFGVNRLVGSTDIDLFTMSAGGQISKGFGVFGSFNLCPFVGYQSIWVNGSSRLVDSNPADTVNVDDNVVFALVPLAQNRIDRVSFGLRFVVAVVQLTSGIDVNMLDGKPLLQYGIRAGVML